MLHILSYPGFSLEINDADIASLVEKKLNALSTNKEMFCTAYVLAKEFPSFISISF